MSDDDRWHVLMPDDIHPAGPESLADIADITRYSEYERRETTPFFVTVGRV